MSASEATRKSISARSKCVRLSMVSRSDGSASATVRLFSCLKTGTTRYLRAMCRGFRSEINLRPQQVRQAVDGVQVGRVGQRDRQTVFVLEDRHHPVFAGDVPGDQIGRATSELQSL